MGLTWQLTFFPVFSLQVLELVGENVLSYGIASFILTKTSLHAVKVMVGSEKRAACWIAQPVGTYQMSAFYTKKELDNN